MKKLGCFLIVFCMFSFLYSCKKDDKKDTKIDKSLLPGKWKKGTLHEKYMADGTGYFWDEMDDVTEEDAINGDAGNFEWTLNNADLTITDIGKMGQKVPKWYKVTELTSTSFKYKDDYGNSYSFQREN